MQTIQWSVQPESDGGPSKNALLALQLAGAAAKNFDTSFLVVNKEREKSVPLFHAEEVVLGTRAIRTCGYFSEFELRSVRIIMDLAHGALNSASEETRRRFSERSIDGHYAVKYLQDGILDSDHGVNAACDMIVETKILMNLAPHPHISQIYGVNTGGIDSFLESGRMGFFIITDKIGETLVDRLQRWERSLHGRDQDVESSAYKTIETQFSERLELAMDIASALVYLHDRQLVFNVRPDKIGFDARYGRVKLMNFTQARQEGMVEHARSITKSDDIRTLAYTAPEVLCKAPATTSSDVYAFGIMMWEMLSLQRPFDHYNRAMHFEQVVKLHERPELSPYWPKQVSSLLDSAWDPHYRPTMKKVHETLETALLFADDEATVMEEFVSLRRKEDPAAASPRKGNRRNSRKLEEGGRKMKRRGSRDGGPQQRRGSHDGSVRAPRRLSNDYSGGKARRRASNEGVAVAPQSPRRSSRKLSQRPIVIEEAPSNPNASLGRDSSTVTGPNSPPSVQSSVDARQSSHSKGRRSVYNDAVRSPELSKDAYEGSPSKRSGRSMRSLPRLDSPSKSVLSKVSASTDVAVSSPRLSVKDDGSAQDGMSPMRALRAKAAIMRAEGGHAENHHGGIRAEPPSPISPEQSQGSTNPQTGSPFRNLTSQFLGTFDYRGFDNIPEPTSSPHRIKQTMSMRLDRKSVDPPRSEQTARTARTAGESLATYMSKLQIHEETKR